MWKPGETVAWRGIFQNRVWHVQPTIAVQDSPGELALTLLPGTECVADENYPKGKKAGRRRWEYMDGAWTLAKYTWKTNRLLLLLEPEKFYSTILFWDHASGEFLCYYINFQLPFERTHCGIDTLDLELDVVIQPDFSFKWKDEDDYAMCVQAGMIRPEWVTEMDTAKREVFDRLENRRYPFDGSWLDWTPDPAWAPPTLPMGWDKI